MKHKHKKSSQRHKKTKSRSRLHDQEKTSQNNRTEERLSKLEIVLKCDSTGSIEAVSSSILKISETEVEISIINSGVGDITHSDILMADTGSRLIVGFQVGVLSGADKELRNYGVELRLYDVIYKLIEDVISIARSLKSAPDSKEEVTGTAKVIELFKSTRKGIIIGCEVLDGHISHGQQFRIISAMGPVYKGRIESMHIGDNTVQKATRGQQVGIKIEDFRNASVGDILESFRSLPLHRGKVWKPEGGLIQRPG